MPIPYRGEWRGKHCRDSPIQTTRNCNCSSVRGVREIRWSTRRSAIRYSAPKGRVGGFFAESIQVYPKIYCIQNLFYSNTTLLSILQGVGGTVQYPKRFLKSAFELIISYCGVCISDEVRFMAVMKKKCSWEPNLLLLGSNWIRTYWGSFLGLWGPRYYSWYSNSGERNLSKSDADHW